MKEIKVGFKGVASGLEKEYYTFTPPFAEKILEEEGISLNKENITPLDLFSVPEGLSSEKKKEIIAKNLNFKVEELEERLADISRYWQEAKRFYRDFLIPKGNREKVFPKEIEELKKFKNLEELENTLSKATVLKKGDKLGYGPFYCVLFTLMIAVREYEKEKFEGLKKESEYFAEQLFQKDKKGICHFYRLGDEDDGWSQIEILTKENEKINAWFSFRGKSKNSMIMKLAIKPEFSVEERVQDGIGLKFEVDNEEDAKKLFLFLSKFLTDKNFSKKVFVKDLVFENINLFKEDKNFKNFLQEIKEHDVSYLKLDDDKKNRLSNEKFQAAKILGKVELPENAQKENKDEMIERNFEIQVVLTNNKNETGLAQHKIYKRAQKLALFSRLFGSFSEKYLDLICQEASEESGLSKEKIKEYFEENFLVRIKTKGSKTKVKKYVAKSQAERWLKAGIFPKNIIILEKEKLSEECQKIIKENEKEKFLNRENILQILERLKKDYKDDIPSEIVRSTDEDNKYKIRRGWFQALIGALNRFCLVMNNEEKSFKKEIEDFIKEITQKTNEFSSADIEKANKLIDKILNFKN